MQRNGSLLFFMIHSWCTLQGNCGIFPYECAKWLGVLTWKFGLKKVLSYELALLLEENIFFSRVLYFCHTTFPSLFFQCSDESLGLFPPHPSYFDLKSVRSIISFPYYWHTAKVVRDGHSISPCDLKHQRRIWLTPVFQIQTLYFVS